MSADFLEALWGPLPDLFGEVRLIGGSRVMQSYHASGADAMAYALSQNRFHGIDAYFGVLPRTRREGTADACVTETSVLWADVDAKKASADLPIGKAIALATINAFPVPPSFLVDSGGGYHAYWRLDRPVPHAVAKPIMAWIADALKGDRVQDAPRVLRIPGTYNWKRGEPVACRLLRFDLTRAYRFVDFEGLMPIPRETRRLTGARVRLENLPEWLTELITEGAPAGQRSETCFRAMIWLLRYGRDREEIRDIFRGNPLGIGEKYDEKPMWDKDRWFETTIAAAEAVA